MKLTITVEDGDQALRVSEATGAPLKQMVSEWAKQDPGADQLLKQIQDERDAYRKLAEDAGEKLKRAVEDLAKAKTGWRYPKHGDKVRCIAEIPPVGNYSESFKTLTPPKVGDVFRVNAIGSCYKSGEVEGKSWQETSTIGLMFTKNNADGTFTDYYLPIEHFEPL